MKFKFGPAVLQYIGAVLIGIGGAFIYKAGMMDAYTELSDENWEEATDNPDTPIDLTDIGGKPETVDAETA